MQYMGTKSDRKSKGNVTLLQKPDQYEFKEVKRLLLNDPQLIQSQLESLQKEIQTLRTEVEPLKREIVQLRNQNTKTGAVYTIWGRKTCPISNGTKIVYSGVAGGSQYNEKGGGSDTLCLPHDPENTPSDFSAAVKSSNNVGHIFGAEYEFAYRNIATNDDVPCAVCKASQASSILMIPAKITCPAGWIKQYSGFLSSEYYDHPTPRDYVCVDKNPEFIEGTRSFNGDGRLFYPVKFKCGSLPCPPYKDSQLASCVVCAS